jgi:hypothetical protein
MRDHKLPSMPLEDEAKRAVSLVAIKQIKEREPTLASEHVERD